MITKDGDLVHLALYANYEPIKFEEVTKLETWMRAMKEEISSIKKNKTWELVEPPRGKKPIQVK